MKKRAKAGDIFVQKLAGGQYIFGKVLLDIKEQCFKSGILEMPTSQLRYGSICYLVETYSLISEKEELSGTYDIVIPGIVVDHRSFQDDSWKVIGNAGVDVSKIDFEEEISFYSGKVVLTRGELILSKETDDPRLKRFVSLGKMNSRNLFDCTLTLLGKANLGSDEVDIKRYDTRFSDPELRNLVYGMLKEDITMSYYDLALKHGFDTSRFYSQAVSSGKKSIAKADNTKLLKGISWSFIGEKLPGIKDLSGILADEHVELPEGAVYEQPEIAILLEYVDAQDNEHNVEFALRAENGKSFQVDELLFKIHNEVVEILNDNDFHFFQGLTLAQKASKNSPAVYALDLGS